MIQDNIDAKMIHIRNRNNKGVVSFRTSYDEGVVYWSMVVCSKKDQFEKKIAKLLCENSPLKHGVVVLNPPLLKSAVQNDELRLFIKTEIIRDALVTDALVTSSGDERHTPKWVDKLLVEDFNNHINMNHYGY